MGKIWMQASEANAIGKIQKALDNAIEMEPGEDLLDLKSFQTPILRRDNTIDMVPGKVYKAVMKKIDNQNSIKPVAANISQTEGINDDDFMETLLDKDGERWYMLNFSDGHYIDARDKQVYTIEPKHYAFRCLPFAHEDVQNVTEVDKTELLETYVRPLFMDRNAM